MNRGIDDPARGPGRRFSAKDAGLSDGNDVQLDLPRCLQIDPTEGNQAAENASQLVGTSYGSKNDPLLHHVTQTTMMDRGGLAGVMDIDNTGSQNEVGSNDQFTSDIGTGTATHTFDGVSIYKATITYADGTTANVSAFIVQDTQGNLFLAPDKTYGANMAAFEAKLIQSVALTGLIGRIGRACRMTAILQAMMTAVSTARPPVI